MKNNLVKKINVSSDENLCPADALMYDFRKEISKNFNVEYARHINISNSSVKYWENHADLVIENDEILTFFWDEIKELQLPPFKN